MAAPAPTDGSTVNPSEYVFLLAPELTTHSIVTRCCTALTILKYLVTKDLLPGMRSAFATSSVRVPAWWEG